MPNPKDPVKLEEYRQKQREHALARGFGKVGYPKSPETIAKLRAAQLKICSDPEELKRRSERAKAIGTGKWMKGRKLPAEVVEKIASHRKGKTYKEIYGDRAEEEAAKRRESNKTHFANCKRIVSPEAIEQMAAHRRGKTYAQIYGDRAKEEASKRQQTNRAHWKDKPRKAQRAHHNGDFHYVEWRQAVFERDDYTCQVCHQRSGVLQVHHIKPWAKYPELRFTVSNGMTVCAGACHRKMNKESHEQEKAQDCHKKVA